MGAAVRCVTDDLASLTVHLRFPAEHWHRIRHSNLIERTFGETRRRTKVIGRLPGEASCLSLVWAVLDRASLDPSASPQIKQVAQTEKARAQQLKANKAGAASPAPTPATPPAAPPAKP